MRELELAEIENISGGEEPLVQPKVKVVGRRTRRDPWEIRMQLEELGRELGPGDIYTPIGIPGEGILPEDPSEYCQHHVDSVAEAEAAVTEAEAVLANYYSLDDEIETENGQGDSVTIDAIEAMFYLQFVQELNAARAALATAEDTAEACTGAAT